MSKRRSAPNPGWFPKGRSGNPKGRPKNSRGSAGSAFEVLVDKTLTVADHGGTREITVEEALQLRTYQDALAGKGMPIREVLKWIMKREAWLAEHEPKAPGSCRWLISVNPGNADAALVLLGIAAPDPDSANLLLLPWAVEAALRRRRGGQRLTEKERDAVRFCTRDPDTLRRPRGTGR